MNDIYNPVGKFHSDVASVTLLGPLQAECLQSGMEGFPHPVLGLPLPLHF